MREQSGPRRSLRERDRHLVSDRGSRDVGGAPITRRDLEQSARAEQGEQFARLRLRIVTADRADRAAAQAHLCGLGGEQARVVAIDIGDRIAEPIDVDDLAAQPAAANRRMMGPAWRCGLAAQSSA